MLSIPDKIYLVNKLQLRRREMALKAWINCPVSLPFAWNLFAKEIVVLLFSLKRGRRIKGKNGNIQSPQQCDAQLSLFSTLPHWYQRMSPEIYFLFWFTESWCYVQISLTVCCYSSVRVTGMLKTKQYHKRMPLFSTN